MVADPSGTTATWTVGRDDVGTLVSRIFDPSRKLPVVLVSPASDTGRPRVDPELLAGRVRAIVAVLESVEASQALTATVGDSFRAFGGAVRVVWPGATSRDHWRRHRVFLTYASDDPQETADRIAAYVSDTRAVLESTPRPHAVPRIDGVTPTVLDRKAHPEAPSIPSPPSMPAPPSRPSGPVAQPDSVPRPIAPAGVPRPGPRPSAPGVPAVPPVPRAPAPPAPPAPPAAPARPAVPTIDLTALETRLDALERRVAALPESLAQAVRHDVADVIHDLVGGGESDAADRERSRADAAEQDLDDLRRRHERTLRELADVRHAAATPAPVWRDPEKQLRHEIEQAWLMATDDNDRGSGPRGFTFGPKFLESLGADLIPRAKTVLMCAEVVARTIHDRRTTHLVEESTGGSKHRTRSDATGCWRAYLKTNSPGAPRLMWWELKDGTVEFALAAHHDDLTFP